MAKLDDEAARFYQHPKNLKPFGPPEAQIKTKAAKLDFSQFHATGDHWPFSSYCKTQYGGGMHHLRLAWQYRWKDEVRRWSLCLIGRHNYHDWYRRPNKESEPAPLIISEMSKEKKQRYFAGSYCAGCGKKRQQKNLEASTS